MDMEIGIDKKMEKDLGKTNRILSLYDRLCNGKKINLQEEVNRSGMSERSIKRDIMELRCYLAEKVTEGEGNKQIVYDHIKNCYYMTENNNDISDYQMIYVISKILLGSKGLSKKEMKETLGFLIGVCNDKNDVKKVKQSIAGEMNNYQGPVHGKNMIETVWKLAQAVSQQNYIEITYRKLDGHQKVKRILEPVGVIFSEYYFYLLAFFKGIKDAKGKNINPTIYRIDRILKIKVFEDHYKVCYSEKFDEQKYRNSVPLMFGGDIKKLKFWYSGPSLEVVFDRIPTARLVRAEDGKYLLSAEVIGKGAEMWLMSQGNSVEIL